MPAAAMPTSMLPAMEKFSSQAIYYFSATQVKAHIARAAKAIVTRGRYSPVMTSAPPLSCTRVPT